MRALISTLLALVIVGLSACGFQLRGSYALPFDTLHIGIAETNELHAQIRRNVEAGSATRIVSAAKEADASLSVLLDQPLKKILSLDASGRVREFQLERTFSFRVLDAKGGVLIAPSQIVVRRDITFSDAQVLSKEAEEALLWRDIQNDLVQQLLRRLATAKPAAATPSPAGDKGR
jgi:LPS-assembly lipoprotein